MVLKLGERNTTNWKSQHERAISACDRFERIFETDWKWVFFFFLELSKQNTLRFGDDDIYLVFAHKYSQQTASAGKQKNKREFMLNFSPWVWNKLLVIFFIFLLLFLFCSFFFKTNSSHSHSATLVHEDFGLNETRVGIAWQTIRTRCSHHGDRLGLLAKKSHVLIVATAMTNVFCLEGRVFLVDDFHRWEKQIGQDFADFTADSVDDKW